MQDLFGNCTFLWHHDLARKLYVDLDASKDFGFATAVYMVKGDPEPEMIDGKAMPFPPTQVQVIMFLSKGLTAAEKRYWPTELEVAGLVWTVRKIRHLIQASSLPTTVFTDHAAAVNIARHHSLTTTSATDKLNLRLVRASIYLQSYDLNVLYRPGRLNGVPADALSRLIGDTETPALQPETETLDPHGYDDPEACHAAHAQEPLVFHATLVEMTDEMKRDLRNAYQKDPLWAKRLLQLEEHEARRRREVSPAPSDTPEDQAAETIDASPAVEDSEADPLEGEEEARPLGLRFFLRDGLIYFKDEQDSRDRLCIPSPMYHEIFSMAHDRHHHAGFHRAYARIQASFYVRNLAKELRLYIKHCVECQLNQTTRHIPLGELNPIDTMAIPYHTVTADWVHGLPPTS